MFGDNFVYNCTRHFRTLFVHFANCETSILSNDAVHFCFNAWISLGLTFSACKNRITPCASQSAGFDIGAFIVTTRYTHVKKFAAWTAPGNYLHSTEHTTWLICYNDTTVHVVCADVLYFPNRIHTSILSHNGWPPLNLSLAVCFELRYFREYNLLHTPTTESKSRILSVISLKDCQACNIERSAHNCAVSWSEQQLIRSAALLTSTCLLLILFLSLIEHNESGYRRPDLYQIWCTVTETLYLHVCTVHQ